MKSVIAGRVYNTETATEICELPCRYYPRDFGYHETHLYRTKNGNYFIAGRGGPMTMWAKAEGQSGHSGGSGLRAISKPEAQQYAESAGLDPDDMIEAGFELQDA